MQKSELVRAEKALDSLQIVQSHDFYGQDHVKLSLEVTQEADLSTDEFLALGASPLTRGRLFMIEGWSEFIARSTTHCRTIKQILASSSSGDGADSAT